jgi:predicted membrane protein
MKRATFGLLLIILGTALLLEIFEVLTLPSWNELWSYWPFILVALGLFFLLQGDTGVFTFFLILIGTLFSLRRFHVYPFTNAAVIWPSIIISAGVSFVLSGSFSAATGRRSYCESPRTSEPGERTRNNQRSIDFLDESVFLSGKNYAVSSLNFGEES